MQGDVAEDGPLSGILNRSDLSAKQLVTIKLTALDPRAGPGAEGSRASW
ncbi:hypothetical protein [Streptomyces mirabilis]